MEGGRSGCPESRRGLLVKSPGRDGPQGELPPLGGFHFLFSIVGKIFPYPEREREDAVDRGGGLARTLVVAVWVERTTGLGAISEVEWRRSLVRLEVGLVGGSGSVVVMVPVPETQMLEQELLWGKDPESSYGHVVGSWTSDGMSG